MKIDDQFNPHLANILQPSKEDSPLTIASASMSDYLKRRDAQEMQELNVDAIREKIKLNKKADKRAEKKLDANIGNIDFNQNMAQKEFDLNKDNSLFGQTFKKRQLTLDEKRVNANIARGKEQLGIQQQNLNLRKKEAAAPVATVNLDELNKKVNPAKRTSKTVKVKDSNGKIKTIVIEG